MLEAPPLLTALVAHLIPLKVGVPPGLNLRRGEIFFNVGRCARLQLHLSLESKGEDTQLHQL